LRLQFFSEAHVALDVLDGDRGVIDQNPTASEGPPSVIRLIVSPKALSTASEARTERESKSHDDGALLHEPKKKKNH